MLTVTSGAFMQALEIYYFAMSLTVASASTLAVWLRVRVTQQAGINALAAFCMGIACWCVGHLMVHASSRSLQYAGLLLLTLAPLNPIFFLHFVVRYLQTKHYQLPLLNFISQHLAKIYFLGIGAGLLGLLSAETALQPWLGFDQYFVMSGWGWLTAGVTFFIGFIAHGLLLYSSYWVPNMQANRHQTLFMFWSGAWGFFCAIGFSFASFNLNLFPYALLLFPSYVWLLVYALLRYELMEVNRWAKQALAWTLLISSVSAIVSIALSFMAQLGFTAFTQVSFWQLWMMILVILLAGVMLNSPVQSWVNRLIYPNMHIDEQVLEHWLLQLRAANNWQQLEQLAQQLLSQQLSEPVHCYINQLPAAVPTMTILCSSKAPGRWHTQLLNWSAASPSLRQGAEVFSAILSTTAVNLEQALAIAAQEKKQLAQQHLTELGGLSAAVAHDLRNPLNIIAMATATADAKVKRHVKEQLQRADHLIKDLLSYSGELKVQPMAIDLSPQIEMAIKSVAPDVKICIDVQQAASLLADPMRLQQILANLLSNASAMLRNQQSKQILIQACSTVKYDIIRIADNGPGVSKERADEIFQPFSSRRPGGTGLGLAIVRRLMEAHGGQVELVSLTPWCCCFQLCFPRELRS